MRGWARRGGGGCLARLGGGAGRGPLGLGARRRSRAPRRPSPSRRCEPDSPFGGRGAGAGPRRPEQGAPRGQPCALEGALIPRGERPMRRGLASMGAWRPSGFRGCVIYQGAQPEFLRLLSPSGGAGGSGAFPGGGAPRRGRGRGLGFWGAGTRSGVFPLEARTFDLWRFGAHL